MHLVHLCLSFILLSSMSSCMSSSSLQMKNLTHLSLYIFIFRPSCVSIEIHERLYPTGPSKGFDPHSSVMFPTLLSAGEKQTALLEDQGCLNTNPHG